MERLLLAEEVAQMLSVSKDRVYSLTRQNLIPHVRIGRQLRFSYRAIEDWISRGGSVS